MRNKKIKIAFLIDKSNNWIENYAKKFAKELRREMRHIFPKFFYDYNKIRDYNVVFLLGYTKIIKQNLLKRNSLNLTVHESDLPKNKGFSPLQYQILKKKNIITASLIELHKKVDSGPIYFKNKIKFDGTELYNEIRQKQSVATFKLIKKFLKKYPQNKKRDQYGKSNFLKKRKPKDSKLNINKSIKVNFNLIRISNNEKWPAFFIYKGKKFILKIYKE